MQRAMAVAAARDVERDFTAILGIRNVRAFRKLFDKSPDGEHGSTMFVFHPKLIGCLARIRT